MVSSCSCVCFALVLFVLCSCVNADSPVVTTAGCSMDSAGYFSVVFDVDRADSKYLAWASFNDSLDYIGWGQLHVHANPVGSATDEDMVYCAGLVEGAITHTRISQH